MAVDEDGSIDVVISQELLDAEQAKLDRLKAIHAQKKTLTGKGASAADRTAAKEALEDAKKQAKEVKRIKTELKAIKKAQKETDDKIKSFFGKFSSLATDPMSAMGDVLSESMKTSRALPIIGAIIAAGGALYKLIEKEFGPGGIFDLRVKVHDAVRSILNLRNLMDIDAGIIFMSSDTRIHAIPEFTNTTSKRDGHVKYNQLTLGYK